VLSVYIKECFGLKDKEIASIITMVEKQKKSRHRYNIFINDEYAFSVHEDIMIKNRLLKGEEIRLDQTMKILQEEERHRAYDKAIRMVGRRPHSVQEIKHKLKEQGFEEDIISAITEMLKEQNYINDSEFAKVLTENRIYSQRKGRNYIRQELMQKGVAQDLIQGTMENINHDDEYQGALHLAKKKWGQGAGSVIDKRRKTTAFLLRRGYTGSVVQQVMKELAANSYEEDETENLEDIDFS
jgi:regulatory protein